jgi:hypothetical protein
MESYNINPVPHKLLCASTEPHFNKCKVSLMAEHLTVRLLKSKGEVTSNYVYKKKRAREKTVEQCKSDTHIISLFCLQKVTDDSNKLLLHLCNYYF